MKVFILSVTIAIAIAAGTAIVSTMVDLSARDTYQSHSGSVRL